MTVSVRPPTRLLALVGLAGAAAGSLAGCGAAASGDASYTDGSYTADGSYLAPSGTETITLELTIANDVVTDVTVTPHATDPRATEFQSQFAAGISDEIVGTDIDQLSVSRVAGSSLTSQGFNEALAQIKSEAVQS
jgi:uncharacterized protein with FMN-binding domain